MNSRNSSRKCVSDCRLVTVMKPHELWRWTTLFVTASVLLLSLILSTQVNAQGDVRYEFSESSRAIMRVGPNQTLDQLIQQIYPRQQALWPQIKREIIQRNPHAINRFTGRLIEGERLKLVTVRKIHQGPASYLKEVGNVGLVKGTALAVDKDGRERVVSRDSMIFEGDRLNTYDNTFMVVNMVDGAQMRIKENSSVRITEYEMKSGFEKGSSSIIDLVKGGLRKITGSIAANPLSIYRFRAGVMTIGVRGTDFVAKLCADNDCEQSASRNDANARLHVVVLDGLITLRDEVGVQGELILGQYAVATPQTKIIVDDAKPVKGLLYEEEQTIYEQYPDDPLNLKKEDSIWPWLIGGALLGIGI